MKRILLLLLAAVTLAACSTSEEQLRKRAVELCQFIPDHDLSEGSEAYMTADFYAVLDTMFHMLPSHEAMDHEWLYYFVTGNGGGEPVYSVEAVNKTGKNTAQATIKVQLKWEDGSIAEGADKEYEVLLKRVKGQWLLDDFDNKKAECRSYVQQVREKYTSGYYIKYLESSDYTKEYIPEFQKQLEAFYAKYGK